LLNGFHSAKAESKINESGHDQTDEDPTSSGSKQSVLLYFFRSIHVREIKRPASLDNHGEKGSQNKKEQGAERLSLS